MENELGWQELKIDDLPSDILVGDYEFHWMLEGLETIITLEKPIQRATAIQSVTDKCDRLYYRKRQPETVSHPDVIPYIDERLKLIALEQSEKTYSWWKGYQEAFLSLRVWVLDQEAK